MKCKNCNSDEHMILIDNEGLEHGAYGGFDTEIYATTRCTKCETNDRIVGDIVWREPTQKTKHKDCVIFFWQDKSGRGESCQMTLRAVLEHGKGEISYHGERLRQWAKTADIGDTWSNSTDEYRRIS